MKPGGAARAAGIVAQNTELSAAMDDTRALAAKVAKVARLKDLAREAQVREALIRASLTVALNQSLIARADLARRASAATAGLYRRDTPIRRRHNRLSRKLDQVLATLTPLGQALVIARAGVWRPARDLQGMAAYAGRGADPHGAPRALFDQAWYIAANPGVSRQAPLVHYLTIGAWRDRDPHPLFDGHYYRARYGADLGQSGVTPLEHFVRRGWALGNDPHPLFDTLHYLGQGPELEPGEDVLSHYLRKGWRQGLSPHPLFDVRWYLEHAEPQAAGQPALLHYVTAGARARISPHPLFDPVWYLGLNPVVAEQGLDPLIHFIIKGAREGLSPSAWFDTRQYAALRGEALGEDVNPLADYLLGGAWSVSETPPGFATAAYLAEYPEAAGEGLTPLDHWARRPA
jgi:hypothetical protein